MKITKRYSDFILLESFNVSDSDKDLFVDIFQGYWNEGKLLSVSEKRSLEIEMNKFNESMNESFYDSLKSRYDKAKEVATSFSDNAKNALKKILDASKGALEFINKVKENLMNSIKDILSNTVSKLKDKLKGDSKLVGVIKEKLNSEKDNLIKDMKVCKEVVSFYKEKMVSSLMNKVETGMKEVLVGSEQPVVESTMILEGENNVIAKLFHGIEHVPPFSCLHHIQQMGESGVNSIVKALSDFTNKLGGPSFVLPVIAAVLGIAFEYNVKGLAKSGLLSIIEFFSIPFISWIVKIIGWVATFIAVVDLIDEISGSNIFREEGHSH